MKNLDVNESIVSYENENPFKVKKTEVPVVVVFDVVRPKRENCLIGLNLTSRSGNGPESIKEFLENMNDFVPIRIGHMKKHSIVNSNSIIYVQELNNLSLHSLINYELLLKGNIKIKVSQVLNLMRNRSRFQDVLLQSEKFVQFFFRNSKIYINKDMIIKGTDNE